MAQGTTQAGGDNLQDYAWLVDRRSQSQKLLLDLYTYFREHEDVAASTWLSFSLFLGTAFSLWRAVFLAVARDASSETPPREQSAEYGDDAYDAYGLTRGHAKKFFSTLIRDNMIAFPQDSGAREWSVGYYLNNALHRLYWLRHKHPEVFAGRIFDDIEGLWSNSIGIGGHSETLDAQQRWDTLHKALSTAFELFKNDPSPVEKHWRTYQKTRAVGA